MAIKLLHDLYDFPIGTIIRDMGYGLEERLVSLGAATYTLTGGVEASVGTITSNVSDIEHSVAWLEELLLKHRGDSLINFNPNDLIRYGYCDANDLATQTTPITVPSDTPTIVTNDGEGPNTNSTYVLPGVSAWNCATNRFDFTSLEIGDTIDIRFDAVVTTTAPNQEVEVVLKLAVGDTDAYEILFVTNTFKTAGEHKLNRFNSIYIGNVSTKDNPGYFEITSDDDATLVVNGWFMRIFKNIPVRRPLA